MSSSYHTPLPALFADSQVMSSWPFASLQTANRTFDAFGLTPVADAEMVVVLLLSSALTPFSGSGTSKFV